MEQDLIYASELDYTEYCQFQKICFKEVGQQNDIDQSYFTDAFYRWKYNSPVREAIITTIRDKGELIAASAFQSAYIQTGGTLSVAWLSGDTAVSPDHRNKKLANPLLKRLIDTIGDQEIAYAVGRNVKSVKAAIKAGMYNDSRLSYWVRPPFLHSFFGPGPAVHQIISSDMADSCIIQDDTYNHLKKSMSYLRWRYLEHPHFSYVLLAVTDRQNNTSFGAFRTVRLNGRTAIVVMDLLCHSHSDRRILCDEIQKRHPGLWMVSLESGNSMLCQFKAGFVRVPGFLSPDDFSLLLYSRSNSLTLEMQSRPWRISTGDWDAL